MVNHVTSNAFQRPIELKHQALLYTNLKRRDKRMALKKSEISKPILVCRLLEDFNWLMIHAREMVKTTKQMIITIIIFTTSLINLFNRKNSLNFSVQISNFLHSYLSLGFSQARIES